MFDQFYEACEQGNFELVHELIEQGISPERKCGRWKGHSPLHFAAKYGDLNSVRTFIEVYRCNARCRDNSGCTPLHCASCGGHVDVVKYLILKCKCDPSIVDRENATLLHYACSTAHYSVGFRYWQSSTMGELSANNAAVAKFLIEHNCDPLTCDTLGRKPPILHLACKFGPLEFVQSLIEEKGCDTNACDRKGDSLLHVACGADLQILKYLMNGKHCDPTTCNQQGYNILHIACQKQDIETVHYLASQKLLAVLNLSSYDGHPKIDSPLLMACKNGSSEIIECFIASKGCNLNEADQNGLTPLHYACNNSDNLQLVEALIRAGANPAHCSLWPRLDSPISIACKSDNLELLKALTVNGANCVDEYYGNTPLHFACQYNQLETIKYLVKTKGSTTMQNKDGELPLHLANTLAAVKLVSSCNVHCKTAFGNTPLHVACVKQKIDIVEYLILKKRCDPSICNNRRETPLHSMLQNIQRQSLNFEENYQGEYYIDDYQCNDDIRSQEDLLEIVYLVSSQCNLHLKAEEGETPLHIACQKWVPKVVEYLAVQKECHPSRYPDIYDNLQIHCACEERSVHLLRVLATAGNINCQDTHGNTALHAACINENIDAVKFLTEEMHCKQDIKNFIGEVPLQIACNHKSLEIIKLVSLMNTEEYMYALHTACEMGHLEAVRYLELTKTKHCDHDATPRFENSPLIACMYTKSLEMVKLVSDYDVNRKSLFGRTALHIACSMGLLDIARYLVEEKKCDTTIEDFEKSYLFTLLAEASVWNL